jgi:hypothetical protein
MPKKLFTGPAKGGKLRARTPTSRSHATYPRHRPLVSCAHSLRAPGHVAGAHQGQWRARRCDPQCSNHLLRRPARAHRPGIRSRRAVRRSSRRASASGDAGQLPGHPRYGRARRGAYRRRRPDRDPAAPAPGALRSGLSDHHTAVRVPFRQRHRRAISTACPACWRCSPVPATRSGCWNCRRNFPNLTWRSNTTSGKRRAAASGLGAAHRLHRGRLQRTRHPSALLSGTARGVRYQRTRAARLGHHRGR